ncbi:ead/Ea22-like family protein [Salmonella enterica subsp. enterica serovar Kiambu]|nr:ead/Ea22-like family protein [Salmonella enterica subsp. enterica serovar Rubislaw]EJB7897013.1 ead/Ea22-like family protein [Salmonella enterica]EJG4051279.1 ead/Ea22-like family protein [Salmonella enterica]
MTIDKQALREVAERATKGEWSVQFGDEIYSTDGVENQQIAMVFSINNESDAEFIAAANPDTVLALLDENLQRQREKDAIEAVALALRDDMRQAREQLEAAERRMAEQSAIVAAAEKLVRCKGRYHSELNYRALAKLFGVITPDLPPLEHENVHYADAANVEITALRQRIAELEASHSKLRDTIAAIHNTIRMDGGYTPLAAILNVAKRAYEESASTAGIKVKGE